MARNLDLYTLLIIPLHGTISNVYEFLEIENIELKGCENMNILVSNDDGINARGIKELVAALAKIAAIYVCAPHIQRSASGHGITIGKPLQINEVEFENATLALEFTGTPADCVKLGLNVLKERGISIDMVFSGINHGGNLGTDTLYSGTVSAAIEGCICGVPAVAVSVDDHSPSHFELACELAVRAGQKAFGKINNKTVLNINTPNLPKEEIKGVKITKLGAREYDDWFEPRVNDEGETMFWYSGKPVVYEGLPGDIDVVAIQEGYASITPLQYDLTNHGLMEEVKRWGI